MVYPELGWQRIADGQTVGHKRISRVAPVTASKVRFRCLKSIQGHAEIRRLAVYCVGQD
jgi:alpha-L-fucosidase